MGKGSSSMNDRHRTKERYNKKHRKKAPTQEELFVDAIVKCIPSMVDCMNRFVEEATRALKAVAYAIHDFAEKIKTMPDEEYQKAIEELKPELTSKQMALIQKIRGDGKNEPNSEA